MKRTIGTTTIEFSDERAPIAIRLLKQSWFKATDPDLQIELLTLPEDSDGKNNWNGFLKDLAARPTKLGGVTQVRIQKFLKGGFGAIVMFEVVNDFGDTYTYEYHSWRYGPMSGAKGIVFVRTGSEITHFIVLRGEKFAPAQHCWDSIGGFIDLGSENVFTLNDRIVVEVKQELGASDINVAEAYDLGRLMTDAGLTSNNPGVFAVVIDAHNASKVDEDPYNPDVYELRAGTYIFPIDQLGEHLLQNEDTFVHVAVTRSVVKGIIPAHWLTSTV